MLFSSSSTSLWIWFSIWISTSGGSLGSKGAVSKLPERTVAFVRLVTTTLWMSHVPVAPFTSNRPVSARELALGLRLDYGFVKRIVRALVAWRILSATPEGLSVQPDATRWAAAPAGGRQR